MNNQCLRHYFGNGKWKKAILSLRWKALYLGKGFYLKVVPLWLRPLFLDLAFRMAGPLFRGMPRYEIWRQQRLTGSRLPEIGSFPDNAGLVDIEKIPPLKTLPRGRIAVHVHIFYGDLTGEFAAHLRHMPFRYDLFVSVPTPAVKDICERSFSGLPNLSRLTVAVVENRGRDIGPLFFAFGDELKRYDFIAHIHSKKSLYNNGATDGWLEYLLDSLLGSGERIRRIFTLLAGEEKIGFVYPQNFFKVPYVANTWLGNLGLGRAWCARLGIDPVPNGYFDFPAGSMFWARREALAPLFETGIGVDNFPEERGQTDETLAHCLERLFVLVVKKQGFGAAIILDRQTPSWSRWRFDQYFKRDQAFAEMVVTAPSTKLVIFDIFDTLLIRPLLDPQFVKKIVAARLGGTLGNSYLQWRDRAEAVARSKNGRDVGLDEILDELGRLSGLGPDDLQALRREEEQVERKTVGPRPEGVALFKAAVASAKRVVLASDMFLPQALIETMLEENGIAGHHGIYLSNAIGLRKDSGKLYRYIMEKERTEGEATVVVGDNERADFQIPCDLGMKPLHILRPVELARAVPRLCALVENPGINRDMDSHLALGLIVKKNFQPLFYPEFDPNSLFPAKPHAIGYSVLGPLVLSFAQWLGKRSLQNEASCLYFLSREGQFLKKVYDCLAAAEPFLPPSDYLVLSRRSVTVPMIRNLEDISAIARGRFFPRPLAELLGVRFGLALSKADLDELARLGLWKRDSWVKVEADGNIDHLRPVLEHLQNRIYRIAAAEQNGLQAYLRQKGLFGTANPFLVDVGYSGTVQKSLNALSMGKVHGFYMMTHQNARAVGAVYDVHIEGCFDNWVSGPNASYLFRESFLVEKMLGCDDPQVVKYGFNGEGELTAGYNEATAADPRTREIRHALQEGALSFVADALAVKKSLVPALEVPTDLAVALFERFAKDLAPAEKEIVSALVLDDHYCGRGLVA